MQTLFRPTSPIHSSNNIIYNIIIRLRKSNQSNQKRSMLQETVVAQPWRRQTPPISSNSSEKRTDPEKDLKNSSIIGQAHGPPAQQRIQEYFDRAFQKPLWLPPATPRSTSARISESYEGPQTEATASLTHPSSEGTNWMISLIRRRSKHSSTLSKGSADWKSSNQINQKD